MTTAGSFSGHLVDSYMSSHQHTGSFGQPFVSSHGPMSFAPSMHGSLNSSFGTQSSFFSDASFAEMSEDSARRIAAMQAKLDKKLGPEYISQRPGPGGGPKLTYAEGWKIINLANEVFGFNGWSSHVVSITTDFADYSEESRRYNVGVTAIVRVTLRDGVYHEDVGYGLLENSKSKGAAMDKCKKEAVTDAVKRTLRNFGNLLGNCLYDKSYTQEVTKIKIPPPKFDRSELHRRPEFEEAKPHIPPTNHTPASSIASTSTIPRSPVTSSVKSEPITNMPPPNIPPRNTTSHNVPSTSHNGAGSSSRPNAAYTPDPKGKSPMAPGAHPTGLQTPVHTPAGRPAQGGDRMAQNLANRHAARLKQIQEAQEAQFREEEAARAQASAAAAATENAPAERRANFAHSAQNPDPPPAHVAGGTSGESPSASTTRPSPPQVPLRSSDTAPDQDPDEYHFPSEDDAFLASIDLDALDEGVGRPIDFEEGVQDLDMDVTVGDAGAYSPANRMQQNGAAQPQQRAHAAAGSGSAPRVGSGHAAPESRPPQVSRFGQSASGQGARARTPSMGGGFNFSPDEAVANATGSRASSASATAQAHHPGQPRGMSLAATTSHGQSSSAGGPANNSFSLKRSADAMQGHAPAHGPGHQRRPVQGMGLQHAAAAGPGGASAHAGMKREPLGALEMSEGGSVKRPRR